MSATSSTSTMFSGTSRYSQDFQNAITRAVGIASLPISELNNDKDNLTAQSTALKSLDSTFSALQSAIAGIDSAAGVNSLNATVSDSSVLGANVGTGAMEGSYTVEVTSIGGYTTDISSGTPKVTDPSTTSISSSDSYTLTAAGGTPYSIRPSGGSLYDLANAINATTDANVRATAVNVGSSTSPDYRLSLQSTKLGDFAVQLSDGTDLMTEQSRGSLASYKVNGISPAATSDSRAVTIAPGLTVNLLANSVSGHPTTITLTQSTNDLNNALTTFVSAYNAAVDELDKHRGTSGDSLAGQSVVYSASSALRAIGSYDSGSAEQSLSSLGITFDQTGHMSYSPLTFMSASFTDTSSVENFLGSATQGGFLKAATDAMNQLEDPTSGVIKTTIQGVADASTADDSRIATEQARVDALQDQLTSQMVAADAAIATMEQQYSYLSQMLDATQTVTGTYK